MALDLTGIGLGISLETGDGDTLIAQVPISGAPSANLLLLDQLDIGSKAYSDDGNEYRKTIAGTGADKWVSVGGATDSPWRDPARVKDDNPWFNLAALEIELNDILTPGNIGGVDSNLFVEGDRILVTDVTGENKNVFVVNGTPGFGATLAEVPRLPTLNDVIRIDEGTSAEEEFYYDGSNWLETGGVDPSELADIRAYIGKPAAGAILPQYNSTQVVSDNDDLTVAIGKLDEVAMVTGSALSVIGGTPTTLDSLLTGEYLTAEWTVWLRETATGDTERFIVRGFHNGSGVQGTALSVRNDQSRQRLGFVNGSSVDVNLTGVAGTQAMDLVVEANNDCDFHFVRTNYIKV